MSDITSLVIRGATRLEPGQPRREVDIVIDDGVITELNILHWGSRRAELGSVHDPHHTKKRKVVIEATGMYVGPGFLDLHAHLREPGQTKKETIAPRARGGAQLPDMEALAEAGAVAFSDDGRNAYDLDLAVEAGRRAAALDRAILVHAQDEASCPDGQVSETVAATAGLAPWPCDAEVSAVGRALQAARRSGGPVHLQHLSCSASLALLEEAKAEGLLVTAEVTPHHLALSERLVWDRERADPTAKVNPPLRSDHDRPDRVAPLSSGLIDTIATDHAPHA